MSTPVCRSVRFTLVELLTVMAIIFIMAALIVGVSSLVSRNMMEAKTKSKLEAMMIALQEYQQDRGYFPQTTVTINVDFNAAPFNNFASTQTARPYLEGMKVSGFAAGEDSVYRDGWNRPFRYELHATEGYRLWSDGADKAAGTEDDVCSWKQR